MCAGGPDVLLVHHGPGRGRLSGYARRYLGHWEEELPELARRVRLHATGTVDSPSMEGLGALVLLLADPLEERYPACHREAVELARHARKMGLPVVNPPDALSNARKARQAALWRRAGLPTPPCRRAGSREELEEAADCWGYPLMVRGDEEHSQVGLAVCRGPADLAAQDPRERALAVSPLVDVRAGYRRRASGDGGATGRAGWRERVRHPQLWRRYHHKQRAYVLGDRVVAFHLFFARSPVVAVKRSLYGPWKARLGGMLRAPWPLTRLALLRSDVRRAIEEEKGYVNRLPRAAGLLREAAVTLGMGHCAVDYSTRADGGVVLWEANPYPAHLTPTTVPLWREREAGGRVRALYQAFGRYLLELTGVREATT